MADNPGLWIFHCHVVLHAAMGMSALISHDGVITTSVNPSENEFE